MKNWKVIIGVNIFSSAGAFNGGSEIAVCNGWAPNLYGAVLPWWLCVIDLERSDGVRPMTSNTFLGGRFCDTVPLGPPKSPPPTMTFYFQMTFLYSRIEPD